MPFNPESWHQLPDMFHSLSPIDLLSKYPPKHVIYLIDKVRHRLLLTVRVRRADASRGASRARPERVRRIRPSFAAISPCPVALQAPVGPLYVQLAPAPSIQASTPPPEPPPKPHTEPPSKPRLWAIKGPTEPLFQHHTSPLLPQLIFSKFPCSREPQFGRPSSPSPLPARSHKPGRLPIPSPTLGCSPFSPLPRGTNLSPYLPLS
jgi:hypothetical protein